MEEIIIYGIGAVARQLLKYIENDRCAKVNAFVVDKDYRKTNTLCGLPVIDFEEVETLYDPSDYRMLISFYYTNMMDGRKMAVERSLRKGYSLYSYISKDANVYTENIGHSVIISPGTVIAPYTVIGNGCVFEVSSTVAHDSKIGDYCYFAPGALTCGEVTVGNNSFLGARCVITQGVRLGSYTFISANTLVHNDLTDHRAINSNGKISSKTGSEKMMRMLEGKKC